MLYKHYGLLYSHLVLLVYFVFIYNVGVFKCLFTMIFCVFCKPFLIPFFLSESLHRLLVAFLDLSGLFV